MKLFKMLLIAHCVLFSMCVYGQENPNGDKDEKQQNPDKIIGALQKEKQALENDTVKLKKKIRDLSNELKAEKESEKTKQIKKLQAEIARLRKDSIDAVKATNDRIAKKDSEYAELKKISDTLQEELNSLNAFKQLYLTELAKSVDEKWMNISYSELSKQKEVLIKELNRYKEFADDDADVKLAYAKLQGLKEELSIYEEADRCASSQYDKANVEQARKNLLKIDGKTGDKGKEVKDLLYQLEDYNINLEIFQDLIKEVENLIKDKDHGTAWVLVETKIKRMEKNDETVSCIRSVKWLAEMYDKYYKELQKNCTVKNKYRNIIMSITLE